MDILFDEQKSIIPQFLSQIIFEIDLLKKLNSVDTIISALDEKTATLCHAKEFKNWLHENYLDNVEFMRQLKIYTHMNSTPETALEYYGQDFLTHQEYAFDEQFEKTILRLNKQINYFVGILLREVSKATEIKIE